MWFSTAECSVLKYIYKCLSRWFNVNGCSGGTRGGILTKYLIFTVIFNVEFLDKSSRFTIVTLTHDVKISKFECIMFKDLRKLIFTALHLMSTIVLLQSHVRGISWLKELFCCHCNIQWWVFNKKQLDFHCYQVDVECSKLSLEY